MPLTDAEINNQLRAKAVARALRRLARTHRDEYETILDAERFTLGLPMRRGRDGHTESEQA